jgi:hypothetical protein
VVGEGGGFDVVGLDLDPGVGFDPGVEAVGRAG